MKEATQNYSYRYSWFDGLRIGLASLILGKELWKRMANDLRCIYVKAYLASPEGKRDIRAMQETRR